MIVLDCRVGCVGGLVADDRKCPTQALPYPSLSAVNHARTACSENLRQHRAGTAAGRIQQPARVTARRRHPRGLVRFGIRVSRYSGFSGRGNVMTIMMEGIGAGGQANLEEERRKRTKKGGR